MRRLLGIILACATPAFPQDTEARARVFAKALGKAADELGVAKPTLTVISLEEALAKGSGPLVAAFVVPPSRVQGACAGCKPRWGVFVVWSQLMSASDKRLQCWARHEMTHVLMDHGHARDAREAAVHHDAVRHFMEAKWKQDSSCVIP